jgi:hypothetical protein
VLLTSCYPDYDLDDPEDFDIVGTFRDDAADFQSYQTYFMSDTIHEILDGGVIEPSEGEFDDDILNEIANQMQLFGYTRITDPDAADVTLYVGNSQASVFSYYPGYWWGYYGWYYPWYGGWYGGYTYSYSTGSLFITMIDREKFDEAARNTGAVWAGIANGVLDYSSALDIKNRAIKSVDQMFAQSPYLKIIR